MPVFIFVLFLYLLRTNGSIDNEGQRNNTKVKEENYNESWIILLTVNDGYFDFFQNWIYFYKKLHLNYHVYVIAEDDIVHLKLKKLHLNNEFTVIRGWQVSTPSFALTYGTKQFYKMMSARPSYILKYLEKGFNTLFTDIDSVWLKDPFQSFNGDFDIWMQMDGETFCTGLMAIKSTKDSIKLMNTWKESLDKKLVNDQFEFNDIYKKANIKIKSLNTNLFPSGNLYFKKFNDSERKNVTIVHNNYIKGHKEKLQRFLKFNLWFPERKRM